MSELLKGRQFQLWEYRVSHGSLLIRSPPPGQHIGTSIDIICVGVEYLAAPRFLGEITVSQAPETEFESLKKVLGRELPHSKLWTLQGPRGRFLVVGVALKIQEHWGDIFDSPFR